MNQLPLEARRRLLAALYDEWLLAPRGGLSPVAIAALLGLLK